MRSAAQLPRPALLAGCLVTGALVAGNLGELGRTPAIWLAGIVLVAAVLGARPMTWMAVAGLAGAAALSLQQRMGPPPVLVERRAAQTLVGTVETPMERTDAGYRFNLAVDGAAGLVLDVTVRGPMAPPPLPGDRLAVSGRPRSGRGYRGPGAAGRRAAALAARGATASISVAQAGVRRLGAGWSVWRRPVQVRRALADAIRARGGDPEGNALARAMAVGDRGAVSRPVRQRFRDAGIAHLLAVSGLHLAAVSLILFWIVRRSWAAVPALATRLDPSAVAALLSLLGAVGYTMATGARTSTVRAVVVVAVVAVGVALCRRTRFVDALGIAAIALVAVNPAIVFNPGFQLSFAATLVLALSARRSDALDPGPRTWRRRIVDRLRQLVSATVWATAATAPITAYAFGELALAGLVSNLIAVPLAELVVLPAALAGASISQLMPAVGGPLLDLAIAAAGALDSVAGAVSGALPAVRMPAPNRLELVAVIGALAAALAWRRRRLCRRRALLALLASAAVVSGSIVTTVWLQPALRDDLTITFLDVGQGDAAVVELPGGGAWLIDAGGLPFVAPDRPPAERARVGALPGQRAVVGFLHHRRIRRLERVILSHPHPDHYRGLAAVAAAVAVDEVWVAAGAVQSDPELAQLLRRLADDGTRIVHPVLDRPIDRDGVVLTALAPRYLAAEAAVDPVVSVNDNSLVVRIERAGRAVLFTGDLEQEGEELLVAGHRGRLAADVVKVPHHGSPTSSTPPLIAATAPAHAIISCGVGNRFGFPGPSVLARWRAAGADVVRTDQSGAITVTLSRSGQISLREFDPQRAKGP